MKSIGDQVQRKYYDHFCIRIRVVKNSNTLSLNISETFEFFLMKWSSRKFKVVSLWRSIRIDCGREWTYFCLVFGWKPLDFVTDGSSPFYLQIDSSFLFQRISFLRQKVNFQRKLLEILSANTNFWWHEWTFIWFFFIDKVKKVLSLRSVF